jgi:hypothetical protein
MTWKKGEQSKLNTISQTHQIFNITTRPANDDLKLKLNKGK